MKDNAHPVDRRMEQMSARTLLGDTHLTGRCAWQQRSCPNETGRAEKLQIIHGTFSEKGSW